MAISEAQLEIWSHPGAGVGSAATYQTVRNALLDRRAPYANRDVSVFLQGSYGNDTNVWAESDVDVVVRINSIFSYNVDALPAANQQRFIQATPAPAYGIEEFLPEVLGWLQNQFPGDATLGNKAVAVAARGNRRSSDVIISQIHRHYTAWGGFMGEAMLEGVRFMTRYGEFIVNYPRQHSDNLTQRHQLVNERLKPTVRIFKNMRNRMADDDLIERRVAPSYFIEGALYNVPADRFVHSRQQTVEACLGWLWHTPMNTLICANGIHPLISEGTPTSWPSADYTAFLRAAIDYWNA
jgi:hypothetical protein